ncbi:MAG: amidohydrolase family protein [Desertimonas sp.]
MSTVLLRDAEVEGRVTDVLVVDGVVRRSERGDGDPDIEVAAHGGALLPGLHDHHLHLLAMAAARRSLDAAGLRGPAAFDRAVQALGADGWPRVVGYHEAHHGPLDRHRLDRLAPAAAMRVQHMTGALWVLNTRALDELGLTARSEVAVERDAQGAATGRIFGGDHLVRRTHAGLVADVVAVAHDLADHGITGVTDMTPTDDPAALDLLAAAVATPGFPLDVVVTGGLALDPGAAPQLPRGPVKLIIGDHDLPAPDDLAADIAAAHDRCRVVACHCASEAALAIGLAAWSQAGVRAGDRIEHGAAIPYPAIASLRSLGLIVVTQPGFVRARGDRYRREVPPDRWGELWRSATLLAGGIGLAASSDAPHGPADPWLAMAAAVDRRTADGEVLGPAERIAPGVALDLYLGAADDPVVPRRVAVGTTARLCLLDRPLRDAVSDLGAVGAGGVVGTFGAAGWRPGD